MQKFLTCSRPS